MDITHSQVFLALERNERSYASRCVVAGIQPCQQTTHAMADEIDLRDGVAPLAQVAQSSLDASQRLVEIDTEMICIRAAIILRVQDEAHVLLDRPLPRASIGPESMQQNDRRPRQAERDV